MTLRIFGALLIVALLSACGGDGSSVAPTAPLASSPRPAGTGSAATPNTTPNAADSTGPLPQIKLQRLSNITFPQMTGFFEVPGGNGRFVVLEKAGRVQVFEAADVERSVNVLLDIRNRVDDSSSELGLLGLAFAPDFATSRAFYLNYTAGSPLRTVVSRFVMDAGLNRADANNETKIIEIPQPYSNHNGGEVRFGPDGMLYIAMGDGGSGNDPQGNGQNRNALLGKILRIDVGGTSQGRAYRIPPDNPFVGQQGAREEVWAWGLRNPWRFSFDRQTGTLWAGDVGQNAREEVDIIKKGANYGWNAVEGAQCRPSVRCDLGSFEAPVIDYPTAGGNCAVVGGFVYRGNEMPVLRGAYVYGDYCSGRIWALRYDGSRVTEQTQIGQMQGSMSAFGEDLRGEIYALGYSGNGGIFKLAP